MSKTAVLRGLETTGAPEAEAASGAGEKRVRPGDGKRPPRLRPINRPQGRLHPVYVDQLVADDHPVRAIWEFVGWMDLRLFYQDITAVEGVAGRTPFDPRWLVSL